MLITQFWSGEFELFRGKNWWHFLKHIFRRKIWNFSRRITWLHPNSPYPPRKNVPDDDDDSPTLLLACLIFIPAGWSALPNLAVDGTGRTTRSGGAPYEKKKKKRWLTIANEYRISNVSLTETKSYELILSNRRVFGRDNVWTRRIVVRLLSSLPFRRERTTRFRHYYRPANHAYVTGNLC